MADDVGRLCRGRPSDMEARRGLRKTAVGALSGQENDVFEEGANWNISSGIDWIDVAVQQMLTAEFMGCWGLFIVSIWSRKTDHLCTSGCLHIWVSYLCLTLHLYIHLCLKETFLFIFVVLYLTHASYCLLMYFEVEYFPFFVRQISIIFSFLTCWTKFNQRALAKNIFILGVKWFFFFYRQCSFVWYILCYPCKAKVKFHLKLLMIACNKEN